MTVTPQTVTLQTATTDYAQDLADKNLNNGDELTLQNAKGERSYIGNFHKGLPHNAVGEVRAGAYKTLLKALATEQPADFAAVTMSPHKSFRKFVNPLAGVADDSQVDPKSFTVKPAPGVQSATAAAEAAELYWMALLRDVPFAAFGTNAEVHRAAAELSGLALAGNLPTDEAEPGEVTAKTIFRGLTPGDQQGPFVSQFLLKDITYGSLKIEQRQKTVVPGTDYLTAFDLWRRVQDGADVSRVTPDRFDTERRYLRSMRDLGQYVHVDALFEAYLNACLILLEAKAPFDPGNPYEDARLKNQQGFGTFGGPHILSLVCEVATRALKAVWRQKWFVHRRLRPEAYGGLVHVSLTNSSKAAEYRLDESILGSEAVDLVANKYGTYLLPMAFPEGSPMHPSYGAGHATVAGACVTILKAWFDESYVLPNPLEASADGTALVPYTGPQAGALTVGGELNKVAANIATGRNMAGVHWRSDYTESIKLGEEVAIALLNHQKNDYKERSGPGFSTPPSFSLTKFDGTTVTIQ